MRWLTCITISFLLLTLIGVEYQIADMMTDREPYVPPGEFVDADRHKLYLAYIKAGSCS